LAPHLGDLAAARVEQRLGAGLAELLARYGDRLETVVSDAHPGYHSHRIAAGLPLVHRRLQHHLAHGLAVLAERGLRPPLLLLSCDGLGFSESGGGDGLREPRPEHRLWGGELLLLEDGGTGWSARPVGGLRAWPLPGGEPALREPRRSALGLLAAAGASSHPGAHHTRAAFAEAERQLLLQAIASGCNSPFSSAVGRLFDAVASLLDVCQISSYEGEAALRLQGAALLQRGSPGLGRSAALAGGGALSMEVVADPADPARLRLDWGPLLAALLAALAAGPVGAGASGRHDQLAALLAVRFHQGLAAGFADLAERAAARHGCRELVLSGGCFQNRLLLELTIAACRRRRLRPHWPAAVPANDGGLAVGQLCAGWLSA
jgi:hydrogenase maturation protein HypF